MENVCVEMDFITVSYMIHVKAAIFFVEHALDLYQPIVKVALIKEFY